MRKQWKCRNRDSAPRLHSEVHKLIRREMTEDGNAFPCIHREKIIVSKTEDDVRGESHLVLLKKKNKLERPQSESGIPPEGPKVRSDFRDNSPVIAKTGNRALLLGAREYTMSDKLSGVPNSSSPPKKVSSLRQRVSHMRQCSMRIGRRCIGNEGITFQHDKEVTTRVDNNSSAVKNLFVIDNPIPTEEPTATFSGKKLTIITSIAVADTGNSGKISNDGEGSTASQWKILRLRSPLNSQTMSDESPSLSKPSAVASTSDELRLRTCHTNQFALNQQQQQQQSVGIDVSTLFAITRPPRVGGESLQDKKMKRERYRAEVYAVNAYLKKIEQARFEALKAEMVAKEMVDEVSWCSDDSSVLPTPRYRSASERKKTGGNASKLDNCIPSNVHAQADRFGGV